MPESIYGLLTSDHNIIKSMLDKLSDGDESQLETMSSELNAHSRAEEMALYELLETHPETEDMVSKAYNEHKAARRLASELFDQQGHNIRFKVVAKLLQEALEHHIKEEEGEMFDKARSIFSDEEAYSIGVEFERHKERIRGLGTPPASLAA